jgi:hypothetical protein
MDEHLEQSGLRVTALVTAAMPSRTMIELCRVEGGHS